METLTESLQEKIEGRLQRARFLLSEDASEQAASELEAALTEARENPYKVEFRTHIELGLTLAEIYLESDDVENARRVLDERAAFAEKIFQIMQATGTTDQKREASGGRIQIRDRARQVALLGTEAPEISVKDWLRDEPATLSSLRGRVVLLEFWATWCKPCREMFGKLKKLYEEYGERGLEIIALTRHYFAYRGTAESQSEELELMRKTIDEHGLEFRVGVAETEATQELYGATGMPTLCLIDRRGLVRYAHFGGGEDPKFNEILTACLDEQA
ncbi:MAG TPA: TlpA disulfide reductase family protein [Pyrinomonadaceae bacterium]|nr:TlpA disulfide reductase family protein [Pyrinomonadaceae bacterium]